MAKNARDKGEPRSEKLVRLERAIDAALAAEPTGPKDNAEDWAATVARREAVFDATAELDSAKTVDDILDQLRRLISPMIDRHVEEYVRLLKLEGASAEFRHELVEAILWCFALNALRPPLKRYSDIRKELLRVSKEATAVVKGLRRLNRALGDLPPTARELLGTKWGMRGHLALAALPKEAARFDKLSATAALRAENLKRIDKGGPQPMVAFRALVDGLRRAFKIATGRAAKVTWNEHSNSYEGKFVGLVEAVLPLALQVSKHIGTHMRYPASPFARGKYIYELTRRGAGKGRRSLYRAM